LENTYSKIDLDDEQLSIFWKHELWVLYLSDKMIQIDW
jgi:hypothetical protein